MKSIFTLFLLNTLILFSANAQDLNTSKHFIAESKVPQAVILKQRELFPSNFVTEWEVQELNKMQDAPNIRYIAKFEKDNRSGFSASYLPEGLLIFHTEFMPAEIIPAEVRLKVRSEYKDFLIQSADFISLRNPKREIYLVKLLNSSLMQFAFYDTVGNEIPKSNLPVEILFIMQ